MTTFLRPRAIGWAVVLSVTGSLLACGPLMKQPVRPGHGDGLSYALSVVTIAIDYTQAIIGRRQVL
jgi:hypothetical protein